MKRDPRELILSRRARFVAASVASFGLGACDPPPARDASVWTADAGATNDAKTTTAPPTDDEPKDDLVKDRDKDGVPDDKDQCPDYFGQKPSGCPMPCLSIAVPQAKIDVVQKIYFDSSKATIGATSVPLLKEVAKVLKDNPQIELEIDGHCDGKEAAALGEKRAVAVRDFLVKEGIPTARLVIKGLGATAPADTNETEGGRENNRRVSFTRTDGGYP